MAYLRSFVCLVLVSLHAVDGLKSYEDKKDSTTLTITTAHREVYDCVQFHQQPAFHNSSLLHLTSYESINANINKTSPVGIGLKDGGCPAGTVPIRKEDRERNQLNMRYNNTPRQGIINPQGDSAEPDHCYAVVRTNDPNVKYMGAAGGVSLYNPPVKTDKAPQWSASRMRLSNGPDSIEAGWMVNKDLFKDDQTHLYIRFMAGGDGCFNLECPGFVQVGQEVPIGLVPDKLSVKGVQSYYWALSIDKHQDDGNWWLSIGKEKYNIGYWPKSLFSNMGEATNQVEWGGEVYDPTGADDPPAMGCGNKPDYNIEYAAYFRKMTLVDESFGMVNPPRSTVKYQNCDGMYRVQDYGYTNEDWGRVIVFGGPAPSVLCPLGFCL